MGMDNLQIPLVFRDIRHHIPVLLAIILFFFLVLIPVEFYILGEGYGYGIKGICYKYQVSSFGDSFIPISSEISYVVSGKISGKSAYAILVWAGGALLFGCATLLYWYYLLSFTPALRISAAAGIIGASLLFLISEMLQYGPFFFGSAGIALPVTIPLLFLTGWFVYKVKAPEKNP
jgi:hypothetical protein